MAVHLARGDILTNEYQTIDIKSQEKVLAWAGYGNSIEKIEFLKGFLKTLCTEECAALRNLIGHRMGRGSIKKRTWVGPKWKKGKNQRLKGSAAESLPMAPQMESRPAAEPWWRKFDCSNVVAVDVEKVSLKALKGVSKGRAAKIAVVDIKGRTLFRSDVHHKPGTFDTSPKAVAISGIRRDDLVDAPKWEDEFDENGELIKHGVHSNLKKFLKDKLVITCDGVNDFYSMDIEDDDYSATFDLQSFFRRPHPECPGQTQPMSLRDMYFFNFKEDFQHEKPHDCTKDAVATIKVFNAYRKIKKSGYGGVHGDPSCRENVEDYDFSHTPNLKSKEKKVFFYCKTNKVFKNGCECEYCERY